MCNFKRAWSGKCNASGEPFCENHVQVKCCACNKQATKECDYTGQFTCGAPLCDDCKGVHDGTPSAWGFIGHKHVRGS